MLLAVLKWSVRLLLGAIFIGGLANCTMLGLNYSSLNTDNKAAPSPALSAEFDAAAARATLEAELFGPWPVNLPFSASEPKMIDADYLGGKATLEEVVLTIGEGEGARSFPVVIALPKSAADAPVPLLISQTFSSNCSAFPEHPVSNGNGEACTGSQMTGWQGFLATQIFGTYIALVPAERYIDAGLGYASFMGGYFVPDANGYAQDVMAKLGPAPAPTSALMAWGYGFDVAAQALGTDPRVRSDAIAALGHSRFGKAALIASGWSPHIAAAVSHQSGFAGAASSRSETGERLDRMVESYPHWVRPGLSEDLEAGTALTLDQHYFLALSAPKPIFLGNGRRDVWSDPNSTFRNAQAADIVYEASGVEGLPDGAGMRDFDPGAEISYWLRVGGHSVVSEDINAFIAFINAHFPAE